MGEGVTGGVLEVEGCAQRHGWSVMNGLLRGGARGGGVCLVVTEEKWKMKDEG